MLIGEIIKEWRYAKRISIREAGKRLDIPFATLSRIENNKPADGKTIVRLLIKLFDIKPNRKKEIY